MVMLLPLLLEVGESFVLGLDGQLSSMTHSHLVCRA